MVTALETLHLFVFTVWVLYIDGIKHTLDTTFSPTARLVRVHI